MQVLNDAARDTLILQTLAKVRVIQFLTARIHADLRKFSDAEIDALMKRLEQEELDKVFALAQKEMQRDSSDNPMSASQP
jgi:hypothetical protein